ncbi:protein ALTERED XYLOGLUCAN 4-like [Papaver somniferum]|uniref:protein ALTERED XYLOGLUCAN 4-like n=1 Tax=Papaver somniferum TaxID=3469 RepID=UPI000E6F934E|nr:protein ALTERED XYLOGLUCAN 4-like [Papaver somniferum]
MMQSAAIFENLPYYTNRNGKGNGMQIGNNFMFKQHYPLVKNITLSALYSENDTDQSPLKSNPATIINLEKESNDEKIKCDLFEGKWIPDLNGPMYTNWSCSLIPDSRNCPKFGRENVDYMNWRWMPNECELPRFDAKTFLSIVRGRKLAFIGDSLARNQMDSLLCLLSQDETPEDVYTDDLDRYRTFYFPSHDFTLMTTHLTFSAAKKVNGSKTAMFDIHLDRIDDNWAQKLPTLDYAIISIGQWFNRKNYLYEGGKVIGCIYCDEPDVPNLGFPFAVGKALEYISDCKECKALFTLARTFSPAHFEYGTWNEGGKCNRTSPYTEKQVEYDFQLEVRKSQVKAFEKIKKRRGGKRFEILDVTRAMLMRPDGHPDINWYHQYLQGHTDCIHWCLPGPVDLWNELLLAVLQSKDCNVWDSLQ